MGEVADLDRTVRIDGAEDGAISSTSELRVHPHVVLLGEPGLGKSTVLDREARLAGTSRVTVRRLLRRGAPDESLTLFVDALDEYRSDGSIDKIHDLATAIEQSGVDRWWLTCRAEDWRKLGDLVVLEEITGGRPIVVAHLQPLTPGQQAAVLTALGEQDPEAFLEKARRLGAEGLSASPLSLRLLHRSVASGGAWPKTRYELFDRATLDLAGEHDPARRTTMTRPAPASLREAAARAFLVQLTTGARGIWRSNVEPEDEGLVRGFDLGVDQTILKAALDTALFTGEGEIFEPIHRNVAEFLAARGLVEAVIGKPGSAATPLSRALALITTDDGGPPTELRGLFGWFIVHLAQRGRGAEACELLRRDPVTVLAYGDAAALPTDCRRVLFDSLDCDDPWFASSQGSAMVGSLAGDDLADLFGLVLDGAAAGTDKLFTVFEALTIGPAMAALRPKLRAIVLDEQQSEGARWRAIDAFLNGSDNLSTDQRNLLDDLTSLASSSDNGRLKAHLIAQMNGDTVTVADLRSVVIDAAKVPRRDSSINLYGLGRWFARNPKPGLLDVPVSEWIPPRAEHDPLPLIAVESFFDTAVAALIDAEDPTPRRLQAILTNGGIYRSARVREAAKAAVAAWLAADPARPIRFLDAMIAGTNEPNRVGKILTRFHALAADTITPDFIRATLWRAEAACVDQVVWFELASALVWHATDRDVVFWDVVGALRANPDVAALGDRMVFEEIEPWRWEEAARHRQREDEFASAVAGNVTDMSPELEALRSGVAVGWLDWAAQNYLHPGEVDPIVIVGLERVARLSNPAIADAVAAGWTVLASDGSPKLTPARQGRLDAQSKRNVAEYPMIAGLVYQRSLGIVPTAPPSAALAVLRNSHVVMDTTERDALVQWAILRLCEDANAGGSALKDYWLGAIKTGATYLNHIREVVAQCPAAMRMILPELLDKRPNMSSEALRVVLHIAVQLLDRAVLLELAGKALKKKTLGSEQRGHWYAAAFRLDPLKYGANLATELPDETAQQYLELEERLDGHSAFDGLPEEAAIARDIDLIRLLGPGQLPRARWRTSGYGLRDRLNGITTAAIARLSSVPSPAAGEALASLLGAADLLAWHPWLRHSLAEQVRVRRDFAFRNPTALAVCAALAGGPPVNAADLKAIVCDELDRIGRGLQTGASSGWRRYWNIDGYSRPINPRNENECRNQVLDLLEIALKPYGIIAALPEGHRANDTRSDMLMLGHAGSNLPLEAKRHHNDELWSAPVDQLEPYTRAPGASGFGIYLVFWFGSGFAPPKRGDRRKPKAIEAVRAILRTDLPDDLRERLSIMVFDVSVPDGVAMSDIVLIAKPRQRAKPL